ncbi:unnamed protein product [Lactuca virosa]|uniref:Rhodopsin n=1 Tax=Lactuca virosa TaxID=75947 RepID=A0AAU9NNM8_9ASTR|nr:unnamed protein product [Lactuca virosa]
MDVLKMLEGDVEVPVIPDRPTPLSNPTFTGDGKYFSISPALSGLQLQATDMLRKYLHPFIIIFIMSYTNQSQPPDAAVGPPPPPQGYPSEGQSKEIYPSQGYVYQGYPPQGYPPQGYSPHGYPSHGYPPQGYPQQGYPHHGYPPQGYSQHGYPQQYAFHYVPPHQPPQGSGFAEGCLAALCCCCLLDACF